MNKKNRFEIVLNNDEYYIKLQNISQLEQIIV